MDSQYAGTGYLALPEGGAGPGILVLHAWWGLTDHVRHVCDQLAGEGYVALAPDLFEGRVATEVDDGREAAPRRRCQRAGPPHAVEPRHPSLDGAHAGRSRGPARLVDGRVDGALAGGAGARRRGRHRRVLRRSGHRHGGRSVRVPRPLRRDRPLRRRGRPGAARVRAPPRRDGGGVPPLPRHLALVRRAGSPRARPPRRRARLGSHPRLLRDLPAARSREPATRRRGRRGTWRRGRRAARGRRRRGAPA